MSPTRLLACDRRQSTKDSPPFGAKEICGPASPDNSIVVQNAESSPQGNTYARTISSAG